MTKLFVAVFGLTILGGCVTTSQSVLGTANSQVETRNYQSRMFDTSDKKMVLRSVEKQTLALGLFSFVTEKKNEFTTFAAGSLIVAIPFVIFFVITQKTLITSFGGAAVKE